VRILSAEAGCFSHNTDGLFNALGFFKTVGDTELALAGFPKHAVWVNTVAAWNIQNPRVPVCTGAVDSRIAGGSSHVFEEE